MLAVGVARVSASATTARDRHTRFAGGPVAGRTTLRGTAAAYSPGGATTLEICTSAPIFTR